MEELWSFRRQLIERWRQSALESIELRHLERAHTLTLCVLSLDCHDQHFYYLRRNSVTITKLRIVFSRRFLKLNSSMAECWWNVICRYWNPESLAPGGLELSIQGQHLNPFPAASAKNEVFISFSCIFWHCSRIHKEAFLSFEIYANYFIRDRCRYWCLSS